MASVNKGDFERLYLAESKSIPDISEITGIPKSTVRDRMIKFGIAMRSKRDGIAAVAHKLGAGNRGKKRIFSDEWKSNLRASILASDRVKDASGVSLKPSGYIEYTTGENKGRSVHVVTIEKSIGRRITSNEVVHHKDENRGNNDPSNLQLMTRAEHAAHHATLNHPHRERDTNGQFK